MKLRNLVHRWAAAGCAIAMVGCGVTRPHRRWTDTRCERGAAGIGRVDTQLDFREATLGTYVGPLDVTLTNTSSSTDQVTGYEFAGNNDFVFDNVQDQCAQALAPGASCLLEFDFLPGCPRHA